MSKVFSQTASRPHQFPVSALAQLTDSPVGRRLPLLQRQPPLSFRLFPAQIWDALEKAVGINRQPLC